MRALKIAFVLDDTLDKPDGVQQYVIALGKEYTRRGHNVHYLVMDTAREDVKNVHSLGQYFTTSFNGNVVRTPKPVKKQIIRKVLDEIRPDVLHVQMPYSPLFASRVVEVARPETRIVGTFHILPASILNECANRLLGLAIKNTLKRFNQLVAVSEPAAMFARKTYGINPAVIPNCVDIDSYRPSSLQKHSSKSKKIVFLGRFVERKGAHELIRAVAQLKQRPKMQDIEVIMAGKGPELVKATELAKSLAVDDIISFPGFVSEEEKIKLLRSADVAVFPSLSGESFGIVLIEAMAAGSRVVLGGNNPGYASVIGAKPELLIDPKDTKKFAKTLQWALQSPERHKITKWQYDYVMRFDTKNVASQLLALYV